MKISNEFKVGLLAIVSLIVFIVGFQYLKGKHIFNSQNTFYVVYDNVQGLVESSPVQYKGLNVGQVDKLQVLPSNQAKIIATLIVDEGIKLSKGSIAQIYSTGLISDKAVNLIQNSNNLLRNQIPENQLAFNGDTLFGDVQMDITETVALEVRPVREKADLLMSSIDSILNVIQGVFDKETQDNITSSIVSIGTILKDFEKTTSSLNKLIDEEKQNLTEIFDNVNQITGSLAETNNKINILLDNNSNKITSIMSSVDSILFDVELITDEFSQLEVKELTKRAEGSLENLEGILAQLNNPEGTLGNLLNNPEMYNKVNSTIQTLEDLLVDLTNNPKKYVQFSLIQKRSAEQKAANKAFKEQQNGN